MICGFFTLSNFQCGGKGARSRLRSRLSLRQRRCAQRRIHPAKIFLRKGPSAGVLAPSSGEKRASRRRLIRTGDPSGGRDRRFAPPPQQGLPLLSRVVESVSAAVESCARSAMNRRCSDSDLPLQEIIDSLRIGLAARCLHHLADEPTDRFGVCLGVGNLARVLGDDVVDESFDRR